MVPADQPSGHHLRAGERGRGVVRNPLDDRRFSQGPEDRLPHRRPAVHLVPAAASDDRAAQRGGPLAAQPARTQPPPRRQNPPRHRRDLVRLRLTTQHLAPPRRAARLDHPRLLPGPRPPGWPPKPQTRPPPRLDHPPNHARRRERSEKTETEMCLNVRRTPTAIRCRRFAALRATGEGFDSPVGGDQHH